MGAGDDQRISPPSPAAAAGIAGAAFPPLNKTRDPDSVTAALRGAQPLLRAAGKKVQAAKPSPPTETTSPGASLDGGWREYKARTATAATPMGLSAWGRGRGGWGGVGRGGADVVEHVRGGA